MEYTSNYKLKKISQKDYFALQSMNDNSDILDAKLKELESRLAALEAPQGSSAAYVKVND